MKYTQEYRIYENDVDFRKMATLAACCATASKLAPRMRNITALPRNCMPSTHTSYVLAKLALHITPTRAWKKPLPYRTEPEACTAPVNRRFTTFCDAQGREEACVDSRWVLIDTDKRMILRKHPEGFPTTAGG